MRPKEYYEQNTIQEDPRFVFALIPSEFEKYYKKFIKEPVEKIKLDNGKVVCGSHFDFSPGTDQLGEIWKSIQKASLIIANISGLKPDIMLELGVALIKKGRVILIAEKSLDGRSNLPFNVSTLKVEFYELDKMEEFLDRLVSQIERWITPDEFKIKDPRVIKLMNDVLNLRREERYEAALLLFESMDRIEPGNWYIYKEWGITFKESKDYNNSIKKLNCALEFTKANRYKAEIYMELGIVYHENNNRENDALISFEKAENLDRDNANIYEKWAYLYYSMGKYQDAMNKMLEAVKLEGKNREYKRKFEFYSKKFLEPEFNLDFRTWIDTVAIKNISNSDGTKGRFRNKPQDFVRFKNRHRPKEELEGTILKVVPNVGVFVGFEFDIFGLVHPRTLPKNFDVNPRFAVGEKIKVKLLFFKNPRREIDLAFIH